MRTVTGNISKITNQPYNNKMIIFKLCDRYGNESDAFDESGEIATHAEATTDDHGYFSINLFETQSLKIPVHYQMHFEKESNIKPIKLFINPGPATDFKNLLQKHKDLSEYIFYNEAEGAYGFKQNIYSVFEDFFNDSDAFFQQQEKNIIETFVDFADEKIFREDIKQLDENLAKLGANNE